MSLRRQFATVVRRFPKLMLIPYYMYRFIQPKYSMGVVGVVMNDQQDVLLVEHVFHPRLPWGLPGGWIGRNEDPELTAIRELKEELGLDVVVTKLLLVERTQYNHIDMAFLCRPIGEIGDISFELLRYEWVKEAQLPRLQLFHYRAIQTAYDVMKPQEA